MHPLHYLDQSIHLLYLMIIQEQSKWHQEIVSIITSLLILTYKSDERLYNGHGFPVSLHSGNETSPGPKYVTRNDPGKETPSFSIPKAGLREKTSSPKHRKRKVQQQQQQQHSEVPGPGAYNIPDHSKLATVTTSDDFSSMGRAPSRGSSRLNFGPLGKDSPGPMYSFDLSRLSSSLGKRSAGMGGLS
jgi:hypothetical protein